jgi:hypothetical protein
VRRFEWPNWSGFCARNGEQLGEVFWGDRERDERGRGGGRGGGGGEGQAPMLPSTCNGNGSTGGKHEWGLRTEEKCWW